MSPNPAILTWPRPSGSTLLISDTFTRADGAMGSPEIGAAPWGTTLRGSFAIASLKAKATALGSGVAHTHVQSGVANCTITCDLTWDSAATAAGIQFRTSGVNDRWALWVSPTALSLRKYVSSSTSTEVGSWAFTPAHGATYTLRVVLNGSSITGWMDGVQRITATDAFNSTATLHGLLTISSTGPTFDNFRVETP